MDVKNAINTRAARPSVQLHLHVLVRVLHAVEHHERRVQELCFAWRKRMALTRYNVAAQRIRFNFEVHRRPAREAADAQRGRAGFGVGKAHHVRHIQRASNGDEILHNIFVTFSECLGRVRHHELPQVFLEYAH